MKHTHVHTEKAREKGREERRERGGKEREMHNFKRITMELIGDP
jgi:hypothetical protein